MHKMYLPYIYIQFSCGPSLACIGQRDTQSLFVTHSRYIYCKRLSDIQQIGFDLKLKFVLVSYHYSSGTRKFV